MANLKLLSHGSFPPVNAVALHFIAGRQYLELGLVQKLSSSQLCILLIFKKLIIFFIFFSTAHIFILLFVLYKILLST